MNKVLGTLAVAVVVGVFLTIAGCAIMLEQRALRR